MPNRRHRRRRTAHVPATSTPIYSTFSSITYLTKITIHNPIPTDRILAIHPTTISVDIRVVGPTITFLTCAGVKHAITTGRNAAITVAGARLTTTITCLTCAGVKDAITTGMNAAIRVAGARLTTTITCLTCAGVKDAITTGRNAAIKVAGARLTTTITWLSPPLPRIHNPIPARRSANSVRDGATS